MPGWRRILLVVAFVVVAASACGGSKSQAVDIPGVQVERAPGRSHRPGPIDYPKHPSSGGDHNPSPLACGFYDQQPPDEYAVHSLEHGAVWIAFSPSLSTTDAAVLRQFAKLDHVIVSPYAGMSVPITLVAWERRLEVESANDQRITQFVDAYRNGPTAPERGTACTGVGQPAS